MLKKILFFALIDSFSANATIDTQCIYNDNMVSVNINVNNDDECFIVNKYCIDECDEFPDVNNQKELEAALHAGLNSNDNLTLFLSLYIYYLLDKEGRSELCVHE